MRGQCVVGESKRCGLAESEVAGKENSSTVYMLNRLNRPTRVPLSFGGSMWSILGQRSTGVMLAMRMSCLLEAHQCTLPSYHLPT